MINATVSNKELFLLLLNCFQTNSSKKIINDSKIIFDNYTLTNTDKIFDNDVDVVFLELFEVLISDFDNEFDFKKNKNIKFIIFDIQGELINVNQHKLLKKILQNKNVFFISQRDSLVNNKRVFINRIELGLLYYFYHLSDNLYIFPQLSDFEIKEKKYDFISFLGLEDSNKTQNRLEFIEAIDFSNKSISLPRENLDRNESLKFFERTLTWPHDNFGSYYWYSLLKSEQAKIKIVFETLSTDHNYGSYGFLTEKTLKCLLHNQPYILILPFQQRRYLEDKFGFKFPYPAERQKIIKFISDLSKSDIDLWIEETKEIYSNNKKIMYKIIEDYPINLLKTLEKIIDG